MAYRVNILGPAEDDVERLILYVRAKWGDATADKVYTELMDKLELLATQPEMGHPVEELVRIGFINFRILVHSKHTNVLYELDEDDEIIFIHIIFDSKRDFPSLLYDRILGYDDSL